MVGLGVGYCTRHRLLLLAPGHSTCGQLLRRDLLMHRATAEQVAHRAAFGEGFVQALASPYDKDSGLPLCDTVDPVSRRDPVVDEVADYGCVNPKISTVAVLRRLPGARAEVAMHSLGRGYLLNCYARDHRWTAGLHLFAWTRQRISEEPDIKAVDLRDGLGLPRSRVNNLAIWQVVTLRLNTVDQIARQADANGDDVGRLTDFATQAITETRPGDGRGLLRWIDRKKRSLESVLSESRYRTLHESLRPIDADPPG